MRIDTVHQGDQDGVKGVYHITCVDAVSQWQVEACVQGISELYLLPVLALVIAQFPFVVVGFHSDNGSEYINHRVARLLEKLRIEQTKSRSRHSNDNALAESKNASVVRKHMGYSHIPQEYAQPINAFYQETFNPWLNLHRPCLFATSMTNAKGKIVKCYRHEDVKTPLACLAQLSAKNLVTFKPGMTLAALPGTGPVTNRPGGRPSHATDQKQTVCPLRKTQTSRLIFWPLQPLPRFACQTTIATQSSAGSPAGGKA
ncbi:hypothetical protein AGMMS50256_39050 [Betaproteobacteria bacterium]|nr:hypothetical protein AGMMS50256_39050 [Betaproteobacteria bacterium]